MKTSRIFVSIFVLALFCANGFTQDVKIPQLSPLQTVKQAFGVSDITIEYSRPSVRGRVIFGELVPFGKVWRTGANATTQITFGDDVKLQGIDVPAGTYGLYTVPGQDSWDIMLYKDLKLAGNVNDYKTENEFLRIKVTPTATAKKFETFTINITEIKSTSATIELLWDNTCVTFGITTEIDAKIMKSIEASMQSDKPAYFQAAGYYYDNDKDLNKALEWVNKAIELNPKGYFIVMLKARIQYRLNDFSGAHASAEQVITLAKDAKNEEFIKLGEKMLSDTKDK